MGAVLPGAELVERMRAVGGRAIHRYGLIAQWRQVQEEACELSVAVSHSIRRKEISTFEALVSEELLAELADVQFMLVQARMMLTQAQTDDIDRLLEAKLQRQEARIAGESL